MWTMEKKLKCSGFWRKKIHHFQGFPAVNFNHILVCRPWTSQHLGSDWASLATTPRPVVQVPQLPHLVDQSFSSLGKTSCTFLSRQTGVLVLCACNMFRNYPPPRMQSWQTRFSSGFPTKNVSCHLGGDLHPGWGVDPNNMFIFLLQVYFPQFGTLLQSWGTCACPRSKTGVWRRAGESVKTGGSFTSGGNVPSSASLVEFVGGLFKELFFF